jgi:hypothetical protein
MEIKLAKGYEPSNEPRMDCCPKEDGLGNHALLKHP